MKSLTLYLLFFIFTSQLGASYLRTIKIASFKSEASAIKAVKEFKTNSIYDEILSLREGCIYDVVIAPTGKYFVLRLEPLSNRDNVKQIEKIIRKKYSDAYVSKISQEQLVKKEIILESEFEVTPELVIEEEIEEKVTAQTLEPIKVIKPVEVVKIVKVEVPVEVIKEIIIVQKEKNLWIWQVLFIAAFFSLLIALIILLSYKKENAKLRKLAIEMKEMARIDDFEDFDDVDFSDIEDFDFGEYDDIDLEFSKKIK